MSLAHDRAEAIAEAIRHDGLVRRVLLMPQPEFTCRVVAIPLRMAAIDLWCCLHAEAQVGVFGRTETADEIEAAIWRAWKVPQGTAASVRH